MISRLLKHKKKKNVIRGQKPIWLAAERGEKGDMAEILAHMVGII